ncbi:MAG: hypothetical protein Q8R82_02460 [Hyphomonadaceae bacterium]|nr:hypothetical protein [Hyphomonadaceae bacterium]
MRGFLIFLGLLLVLGGGAVAGAQYANLDLSMLDSVAGAKEFLLSPMALYAGGGASGFGLLLIIIAAATGGKKKEKPAKAPKTTPAKAQKATQAAKAEDALSPAPAAPKGLAPEPPRTVVRPPEKPPEAPAPQPAMAAVQAPPWAQGGPASTTKPTASGQPPEDAYDPLIASRNDPRLLNRKRVSDLVSINDALKSYHARNGGYPKAESLSGFLERGAAWIPGIAPEFLPDLPRDPAQSSDKAGPQYVYVSDGKDYKLLAQGVSLIGGTNVEVLGVRIDPTRQPTAENAAFGFWSAGFASA